MGFPPPKPIEMLVAPYTEPAAALKNLIPQLSEWSQRHGGPGIKLDKVLEPPKPAQAAFFCARGQYESWRLGGGGMVFVRLGGVCSG
jgi:hypothetical protein